jgi:hypothetical protein
VIVFRSAGHLTKNAAIGREIARVTKQFPSFRFSSYFTTHSSAYVPREGHTTFAEAYAPGQQGFNSSTRIKDVRRAFPAGAPPGVTVNLTGRDALDDSEGGPSGPSVLTQALIGGTAALVILLFVFGTLPAVAMPILSRSTRSSTPSPSSSC